MQLIQSYCQCQDNALHLGSINTGNSVVNEYPLISRIRLSYKSTLVRRSHRFLAVTADCCVPHECPRMTSPPLTACMQYRRRVIVINEFVLSIEGHASSRTILEAESCML